MEAVNWFESNNVPSPKKQNAYIFKSLNLLFQNTRFNDNIY